MNTRVTVILSFEPKENSNNLLSIVDQHREVETWANNVQQQYIGAHFNVKVLECFTGENAMWDDEKERSHS